MSCANFYTAIAAPDGSLRLAAVGAFPLGAADWTPDVPQFYEALVWKDSGTPLAGLAGFGAAGASNGSEAFVYQASLSPIDRIAPSTIPASQVKAYVMSTEVDVQAGGAADNSQGVGIYQYLWYRDNQFVASTFSPEYVDKAVAAGSTHSYSIAATDYDGNTASPTSFKSRHRRAPPSRHVKSVFVRPVRIGAPWVSRSTCAPAI